MGKKLKNTSFHFLVKFCGLLITFECLLTITAKKKKTKQKSNRRRMNDDENHGDIVSFENFGKMMFDSLVGYPEMYFLL